MASRSMKNARGYNGEVYVECGNSSLPKKGSKMTPNAPANIKGAVASSKLKNTGYQKVKGAVSG